LTWTRQTLSGIRTLLGPNQKSGLLDYLRPLIVMPGPEKEAKKQLAAREALDIIEEISTLLVCHSKSFPRLSGG
jgi:hypothetical protein